MPAPQNLSFETASGSPIGGGAASWTLVSTVGAVDWALFDTTRGYEGFDRGWSTNEDFIFAFALPQLEEAAFAVIVGGDPLFYEGFDRGWFGNENFEFEFAGLTEAAYGGGAVEDFEVGWANDTFLTDHAALTDALFDAGARAYDAFEDWFAPLFAFAGPELEHAIFGAGAGYFDETFVDVRPGGAVAFDAAADTVSRAGHAYTNGERVRFAGDLLPAPLDRGVWYYVVGAAAGTTFQVAYGPGGAAIDLVGAGGDATVEGDPARYWTTVMKTI